MLSRYDSINVSIMYPFVCLPHLISAVFWKELCAFYFKEVPALVHNRICQRFVLKVYKQHSKWTVQPALGAYFFLALF